MRRTEYHTDLVIAAPPDRVWSVLTDFDAYPDWNPLVGWLEGNFETGGQIRMFITPLGRAFRATLGRVEAPVAFSWTGVQGARWLLSGEHYYRLEPTATGPTRLVHGEWFRGLGSAFLPPHVLRRMERAFAEHNHALKKRVESHV